MESFFLPILIFVVVFLGLLFVWFKTMASKSDTFTKTALNRIYSDTSAGELAPRPSSEEVEVSPIENIPFIGSTYKMMQRAEVLENPGKFIITNLLVVAAIIFLSLKFLGPVLGLMVGVVGAFFAVHKLLSRAVRKKEDAFMAKFPDALDMIARSVRSGFPLNTALRIIGENMDPPISTEFKRLVDEITYGRSLPEALYRMSDRVGLPDVQFFAVVLTVQQETGGSLAEVMTNLAGIIRKRKQLRMKIAALTSEGRATAIILGGLPIVVLGAIQWTSPTYLVPLYETTAGNWILFGAISLIVMAFVIVNKMIDIDI